MTCVAVLQEALMYRQSKERRIATSEGSNYKAPAYPKCIHVVDGSKCAERTVPLSKFCPERILYWIKLRLFSLYIRINVFSLYIRKHFLMSKILSLNGVDIPPVIFWLKLVVWGWKNSWWELMF